MLDLRLSQTRFSLGGTGEILAKDTEKADVHFNPLTAIHQHQPSPSAFRAQL
jgi:hypothetical protein